MVWRSRSQNARVGKRVGGGVGEFRGWEEKKGRREERKSVGGKGGKRQRPAAPGYLRTAASDSGPAQPTTNVVRPCLDAPVTHFASAPSPSSSSASRSNAVQTAPCLGSLFSSGAVPSLESDQADEEQTNRPRRRRRAAAHACPHGRTMDDGRSITCTRARTNVRPHVRTDHCALAPLAGRVQCVGRLPARSRAPPQTDPLDVVCRLHSNSGEAAEAGTRLVVWWAGSQSRPDDEHCARADVPPRTTDDGRRAYARM